MGPEGWSRVEFGAKPQHGPGARCRRGYRERIKRVGAHHARNASG